MSKKILIVDDKQMMRDSVGKTLQRAGFTVVAAADGRNALNQVARHEPAAVVTDLKMPEMDGLALLGELKTADPHLPVILMTAYGSVNDAVEAMKVGAFDFIQKPFEGKQLVMLLRRALEHRQADQQSASPKRAKSRNDHGQHLTKPSDSFDRSEVCEANPAANQGPRTQPGMLEIVGESEVMRNLSRQIRQIAASHAAVLIQGESGTGKEVVARAIHRHSPRADQTLLCLNCAALSSSLLESELFGHEKGAFTGADQRRKGRFELADGGTLLLDEISEISPQLQAKLLRILQEGQFERVGSSQTLDVDVRVIATTNRNLSVAVEEGTFRQDLFYRLNVLPIVLPPLRDRTGDVPHLAEHFLEQAAKRDGNESKAFSHEALELLQRATWPGNVRELQNICERAYVLSNFSSIAPDLLEPWLMSAASSGSDDRRTNGQPTTRLNDNGSDQTSSTPSVTRTAVRPLEEIEREQILRALDHYDGNRARSAEALGIGVRTLGLKLKKWKQQNVVAESV